MFRRLREMLGQLTDFEKAMAEVRSIVTSDKKAEEYKVAIMKCAHKFASAGYTPKQTLATMKAVADSGLIAISVADDFLKSRDTA